MLKEMCVHGHVHICVCAQECLCGCAHFDMMKDLWDWVVIMLLLHNHDIQRLLAKKTRKEEKNLIHYYPYTHSHTVLVANVSSCIFRSQADHFCVFSFFFFF